MCYQMNNIISYFGLNDLDLDKIQIYYYFSLDFWTRQSTGHQRILDKTIFQA